MKHLLTARIGEGEDDAGRAGLVVGGHLSFEAVTPNLHALKMGMGRLAEKVKVHQAIKAPFAGGQNRPCVFALPAPVGGSCGESTHHAPSWHPHGY